MAGVWLAILAVAQRRITALGRITTLERPPATIVGRSPALIALLVAGLAVLSLVVVV